MLEKTKNSTLLGLVIFFTLVIYYPQYRIFSFNIISNIILGIVIKIIFAWLLHFIAFKLVNYKLIYKADKSILKNSKILYILSVDFLFAEIYKSKLPKVQRGEIIKYSNLLNVILASTLGIFFLFSNNDCNIIIRTLILYHVISRIVEITYAFYNDIIGTEKKSSNLKYTERIKLAINSYFEIIILYGIIYYLFLSNDYINSMLYSITVSTFNFSFNDKDSISNKYIILTQVFASTNLVVLSIATYIGEKMNEKNVSS